MAASLLARESAEQANPSRKRYLPVLPSPHFLRVVCGKPAVYRVDLRQL
jgi:hypothetical protein